MSYVEENLIPGEKVLYQATIHWIIFIPGIIFVIIGGLFFLVTQNYLTLVLIPLGGLMLLKSYIQRKTTEFAVTSKRIIAKIGWVSRAAFDMSHNKIESILMEQTVTGRILNYGTLLVHGTGSGIEAIGNIEDPLTFRKTALAAIEEGKSRQS